MNQSNIRNFAIIAHIDHGKSTLADRLLEMTGTVAMRDMQAQLLDSNPIERERGITIKLAPVRMEWKSAVSNEQLAYSKTLAADNYQQKANSYILNLIDTPGHVDFGYEVSRSLAACEGAILVVDATQGVQAQTLANLHQARAHDLTIIPVINKIDMPNARVAETRAELRALGFRDEDVIEISAKTGQNVGAVLEAVVTRIPPPRGEPDAPLRALIFSSQFDTHKGVVVLVRVVDGTIRARGLTLDKLRFMATGAEVEPLEVGYFIPKMIHSDILRCGEVGYIATGLKDVRMARVGDTVTVRSSQKAVHRKAEEGNSSQFTVDSADTDDELSVNRELSTVNIQPLPGYKEPKSMVFLGLFPVSADEYQDAREAVEKLQLSDSAFTFRPISSLALGNGFHCGFLGLLHAEVVQERLLREFNLTMLATSPSVEYHVTLKPGVQFHKLGFTQSQRVTRINDAAINDLTFSIQSASELPDPTYVEGVKEPLMQVAIFTPKQYVGAIMQLSQEKRGEFMDMKYLYQNSQKTQNTQVVSMPEDQTIRQSDHSDSPIIRPSEYAEFSDTAHVELTYLIPLSEMIVDFFDRLKSVSEGYASLDYEFFEWAEVDVAKVDILVNKEKVDALSFLVTRDAAVFRSRIIVEKLAEAIPRQQFEIPIQAAIGGQVIARADVKAFRKDVTKKLYGGDRTRKDKLLDKQKKGKAKMKMVGKVQIPQGAFFQVLKRSG